MPGYIPFTRLSYLRGAIRVLHLCLSDLLLSGDDPDFPARQWARSEGNTKINGLSALGRRRHTTLGGLGAKDRYSKCQFPCSLKIVLAQSEQTRRQLLTDTCLLPAPETTRTWDLVIPAFVWSHKGASTVSFRGCRPFCTHT